MQTLEKKKSAGLGPETITRRVLANGMTLLVYQNPTTPALVARLAIKGGAMYDPEGKEGLASFMTRAMRRGTHKRNFNDLNEDTENIGASIGVDAGKAMMDAGGRALKEDTDYLLGTIAEVVLTPSFPEDEIAKLRAQLRTGLFEMETDTGSVAERAFREAVYPLGHPYHTRTAGYLETLDGITRGDMVSFYDRYFRPERAVMVVVGDVEPDDLVQKVDHLFGDWKPSEDTYSAYEIEPVTQPGGAKVVQRYVAGKTQNEIILGFPGLSRKDPDYYAFDLMNLLLGRIGLMGRLGKTVRDEQGLAYHAGSSFEAGLGAGPWAVRAGVNPMNVPKAISSITHEIERMRTEPIPAEELEGGKRYMTGVLPLRLETSDGISRSILEIELFDLGFDYIARYPQMINALTPEVVGEVASRRLSSGNYVAAIAGPTVEGV